MTYDDVIKLAREAGDILNAEWLQRFAALVAAAEREACAKVADAYHIPMCNTAADAIAAAIRARGEA